MAILEQSFDPAVLTQRIADGILYVDSVIFCGDWHCVLREADEALSRIATYRACRNEGMEEPAAPAAMWFLLAYPFSAIDIYAAADAWVTDAEKDLRDIIECASEYVH